jgi:hypothetical protein
MENLKDYEWENRIIFDDVGNVMFVYEVKHRQEAYNG